MSQRRADAVPSSSSRAAPSSKFYAVINQGFPRFYYNSESCNGSVDSMGVNRVFEFDPFITIYHSKGLLTFSRNAKSQRAFVPKKQAQL